MPKRKRPDIGRKTIKVSRNKQNCDSQTLNETEDERQNRLLLERARVRVVREISSASRCNAMESQAARLRPLHAIRHADFRWNG